MPIVAACSNKSPTNGRGGTHSLARIMPKCVTQTALFISAYNIDLTDVSIHCSMLACLPCLVSLSANYFVFYLIHFASHPLFRRRLYSLPASLDYHVTIAGCSLLLLMLMMPYPTQGFVSMCDIPRAIYEFNISKQRSM